MRISKIIKKSVAKEAYNEKAFIELKKKIKRIKKYRRRAVFGFVMLFVFLAASIKSSKLLGSDYFEYLWFIPFFIPGTYCWTYMEMLDEEKNKITQSDYDYVYSLAERMPKKKKR